MRPRLTIYLTLLTAGTMSLVFWAEDAAQAQPPSAQPHEPFPGKDEPLALAKARRELQEAQQRVKDSTDALRQAQDDVWDKEEERDRARKTHETKGNDQTQKRLLDAEAALLGVRPRLRTARMKADEDARALMAAHENWTRALVIAELERLGSNVVSKTEFDRLNKEVEYLKNNMLTLEQLRNELDKRDKQKAKDDEPLPQPVPRTGPAKPYWPAFVGGGPLSPFPHFALSWPGVQNPFYTRPSGGRMARALCIGLNEVDSTFYGRKPIRGVRGGENDAVAMYFLAARSGLLPTLLTDHNASWPIVQQYLLQAARELKQGDTLVVTFAGPGALVEVPPGFGRAGIKDRAWCLKHGLVFVEELRRACSWFEEGVNIIVVSDTGYRDVQGQAARARSQEVSYALEAFAPLADYYWVRWQQAVRRDQAQPAVRASVIMLHASNVHEPAFETDGQSGFRGVFTATLERTLGGLFFRGNYYDLVHEVARRMRDGQQTPYLEFMGKDLARFVERPLFDGGDGPYWHPYGYGGSGMYPYGQWYDGYSGYLSGGFTPECWPINRKP